MDAAIQSMSHVHDNNPQSQPGLQQTQSRVLRSISTQTSTSSSMRMCELMSNMQEHRLITSQWWKLLTDARETTNNENGSQGTTGTIYGVRINELTSNTRRITRSEANDVNLSSNATNLPLRHAGSKVPYGVSRSTSWIMSWCRQEVTLIEGGP